MADEAAFQEDAFQGDAFQTGEQAPEPVPGTVRVVAALRDRAVLHVTPRDQVAVHMAPANQAERG